MSVRPTEELKEEHRLIERMLAIASAAADKLDRGESVDPEVFEGAAEFFREFADKCHHAREERLLFQRMVEKGMPSDSGPIAVMLHEHEEGRAHVRSIAELAKGKRLESDRRELVRHVREYVDLLTHHIQKEDNILYSIADDMLAPEDVDSLEKEFREVEEKVIGPGVHQRYQRMIEEWERRFR